MWPGTGPDRIDTLYRSNKENGADVSDNAIIRVNIGTDHEAFVVGGGGGYIANKAKQKSS